MKKCTKCDKELPISSFGKRKDKLRSQCRKCEAAYKKSKRKRKTTERLQPNGDLLCTKCKSIKSPDYFYDRPKRKCGKDSWCKDCHNEKNKCWVSTATKYTQHRNSSNSKFAGNRKLLKRFYNYYNQKSRRDIVDFELTLDDFANLTSSACNYCGQFSPGKKCVGIDRVDSNVGYTLSNCVSCCSICNYMKRNYTKDFFLSHVKKIVDYNE